MAKSRKKTKKAATRAARAANSKSSGALSRAAGGHSLFQKYSQALRLPFLVASIIPILAAGALAWHDGAFNLGAWLIVGLAVLLAHAGTNLANDYFDYLNGNYPKIKRGPTGGSFAIQSGQFRPEQIIRLAMLFFLLSLILFGVLAAQGSPNILLLGLLGIVIGFFYTAPPLQLGYRHLGELATFLGMGPVLFQTVYYAQAGQFSVPGWALSVFLGFLVSNILLAAQVPDIEEDRASGKHTIASVWGEKALQMAFLVSTVLGALALIYGVMEMGLPAAALLGLVGTLFSLQGYARLRTGRPLEGLESSLQALQIGGVLAIIGLLLVF